MLNQFLLSAIDFKEPKLWLCVAVAAVAYLIMDKMLDVKHKLDTTQFKAAQAGGVAAEIGFKLFDDLLFWCGAGNIKEIRNIVKTLWSTYCQDPRGPMRLARDVFMATWGKLRNDPEFGNECRQHVVSEALGIQMSDKLDVDIARAADRAEKLGWSKIGKAGIHWAGREWNLFAVDIRGLFEEFMEVDGEKKIASRVAEPTLEVLWNDPKFRPQVEALVMKYHAKITPTS